MVKINPTITLLSEIYNSRLPRVHYNFCESTGMLNVDEGIMLIDNRLKILQRQSAQIQNARFIAAFLSSSTRTALLFQNASPTFFNNAMSV